MNRKRLVIIGAGGFAREVRMLARDITNDTAGGSAYEFVGYVISDKSKIGPTDSENEILGEFDWLRDNRDKFDCLALGMGYAAPRLRVSRQLEPEFGPEMWPPMIHPSANFDRESCQVGHGVQICSGVQGTVNLDFQPFSVVNYGCTIGHETVLGRACAINPGANISGGVRLGSGVLIGTGAQVLQYLEVGENSIVGAGALVTKSIPADVTVVGVPARVRE